MAVRDLTNCANLALNKCFVKLQLSLQNQAGKEDAAAVSSNSNDDNITTEEQEFTVMNLLSYAWQIAKGMVGFNTQCYHINSKPKTPIKLRKEIINMFIAS